MPGNRYSNRSRSCGMNPWSSYPAYRNRAEWSEWLYKKTVLVVSDSAVSRSHRNEWLAGWRYWSSSDLKKYTSRSDPLRTNISKQSIFRGQITRQCCPRSIDWKKFLATVADRFKQHCDCRVRKDVSIV